MTLTAQTRIGLTFGQIFAVVSVVVMLVLGYANLQIRMSIYEQKQLEMQSRITSNEKNIELVRTENREDHKTLIIKMDELILMSQKEFKSN